MPNATPEQWELLRAYVEAVRHAAARKDAADAASLDARTAWDTAQACWRNCRVAHMPYGAYILAEYGVVLTVAGGDYPAVIDIVEGPAAEPPEPPVGTGGGDA